MTQEMINFFLSATNSLNKQERATFSSDTSIFPSTGRDNMAVVLNHTRQAHGTEREKMLWCINSWYHWSLQSKQGEEKTCFSSDRGSPSA